MSNEYINKHKKIIEMAGGIVNDIFVETPGVMITKKSNVTEDALNLFEALNLDVNNTPTNQHAEFNSKITYLSFKENNNNSDIYLDKLINEHGHRSIYNDEHVTLLIAGCSMETMIEFIAHNEGTVSRLTSSKTNAQNDTLYRIINKNVSNEFVEFQKDIVKDFIKYRKQKIQNNTFDTNTENEIKNMYNFGNKAISFTISMSIKDWHKTLIGRLSNQGVEIEMLEICEKICNILHKIYPNFIYKKEDYYNINNKKKY